MSNFTDILSYASVSKEISKLSKSSKSSKSFKSSKKSDDYQKFIEASESSDNYSRLKFIFSESDDPSQMLGNAVLKTAEKAVSFFIGKRFYCFFYKEEIEDIVMDTAERVLKYLYSFNPEKSTLENWIWTIAENRVKTAAKNRKMQFTDSYEENDSDVTGSEDTYTSPSYAGMGFDTFAQVSYDNVKENLDKILLTLNPIDRKTFRMHQEGYKASEIAEELNCTTDAVYVRLSKVKDKIQEAMVKFRFYPKAA